ncbi:hypothetical protein D3C77_435500 [compost metagenome]
MCRPRHATATTGHPSAGYSAAGDASTTAHASTARSAASGHNATARHADARHHTLLAFAALGGGSTNSRNNDFIPLIQAAYNFDPRFVMNAHFHLLHGPSGGIRAVLTARGRHWHLRLLYVGGCFGRKYDHIVSANLPDCFNRKGKHAGFFVENDRNFRRHSYTDSCEIVQLDRYVKQSYSVGGLALVRYAGNTASEGLISYGIQRYFCSHSGPNLSDVQFVDADRSAKLFIIDDGEKFTPLFSAFARRNIHRSNCAADGGEQRVRSNHIFFQGGYIFFDRLDILLLLSNGQLGGGKRLLTRPFMNLPLIFLLQFI